MGETSNKSLTEIFKPHWPYEAFWAIPLIDQIKPRLALKTASDGRIVGRSRCVEIDNLEQRRLYNKLAKMNNEQLHRVACKAMKLAIREIDYLPIFEKLDPDEEILLKFIKLSNFFENLLPKTIPQPNAFFIRFLCNFSDPRTLIFELSPARERNFQKTTYAATNCKNTSQSGQN